jgi:hypothetical protein
VGTGVSTERRDDEKAVAAAELAGELDRILGQGMGVHTKLFTWGLALPPFASATAWLVLYGLASGIVALLALLWQSVPQPKLFGLLAWGGGYFTAAMFFARRATDQIRATVADDIVPYAESSYLAAVTSDLRSACPPWVFRWLPPLLGGAALALAGWAIVGDLWGLRIIDVRHIDTRCVDRDGCFPIQISPQLVFWALTYFLYLFTAVQAVLAARFHRSFARELELQADTFYILEARETALVKGLAKLGGQVLGFWVAIFLVVLSIMILAVAPDQYRLGMDSKFLLLLVSIAGFFSFGYGTIVYLDSESIIRATLRRFTLRHAADLQVELNALVEPALSKGAATTAEAEAERKRLADLHDQIVAGGDYGSRMKAGFSLVLPFVPLAGILISSIKLVAGGS